MRNTSPAEPEFDVTEAMAELRRLHARVDALTEAVKALARGLERGPLSEPRGKHDKMAEQAARQAHELLLLAEPDRHAG